MLAGCPPVETQRGGYLDCFVVDQGVHGDCCALVVGGVGLLAEFRAPGGGFDSEDGVRDHCGSGDGGERPAIFVGLREGEEGRGGLSYRYIPKCSTVWISSYQYPADHGYLQKYGNDMEDHRREQEADALRPAVDGPTQTAGLAGEVEVEVEAQEVVKHIAGHPTDRLLRDVREDGIADLLEHRGSYPGDAVYLNFNPDGFVLFLCQDIGWGGGGGGPSEKG